jgi:trans-aconitate 2-methyltransferase
MSEKEATKMADWNAGQYLKFKTERTQPAIDLARSMELQNPSRIADIGCGPGNSTAVLCAMFPQAKVTGYDSSADMLKAARENCPEAEFKFCDVSKNLSELGTGFDVVFSNACLQWVPEHRSCIPGLLAMLKPGGVLAVQIPNNFREPIHRIISAAVTSEHWRKFFPSPRIFYTLTPEEYCDLLAEHSVSFRIWETTYYHILPSQEAILEWYRSTGLKPYLDVLPEEKKPEFEAEIMRDVRKAYPAQKDGTVIFRFPRLFFIAVR